MKELIQNGAQSAKNADFGESENLRWYSPADLKVITWGNYRQRNSKKAKKLLFEQEAETWAPKTTSLKIYSLQHNLLSVNQPADLLVAPMILALTVLAMEEGELDRSKLNLTKDLRAQSMSLKVIQTALSKKFNEFAVKKVLAIVTDFHA